MAVLERFPPEPPLEVRFPADGVRFRLVRLRLLRLLWNVLMKLRPQSPRNQKSTKVPDSNRPVTLSRPLNKYNQEAPHHPDPRHRPAHTGRRRRTPQPEQQDNNSI
ncbi:hypothetical protein EYF80_068399 [Liparis tanakae]|uniref:Uncharacterized protein n=1 Tax=Liparis tanakae TaxID=230148 RepID=A0A4Z2DZ26_9TELE|nr:hypothetical protein EYF80_068399 [Liparis tanakae]